MYHYDAKQALEELQEDALLPHPVKLRDMILRTQLGPDEAKELAVRAVRFKKERGRLPSISSTDAWEKRMAEGAAAFVRFKDEGRYE